MAFQRPFVISLKRADSRNPWGFQVFGGKEYGAPHVVQSVGEDSLAEQCGLRQGDEVIQVGRINTQDLTLPQLQELLIRCGNKIEMFVIREDLLTPRKGKEPPVVKAVVHNPYNSPLQLYSTVNIAETLAKQTEVLTEGHVSAEEDEGPENLSFKQKSEVFKLLEEQSRQESPPLNYSRSPQSSPVKKPTTAPPPPPKPQPPPTEHLYNGVDSHHTNQQVHQKRVEFQSTTEKVVNQYHYQEPTQQTRAYQQVSGQPSYQQQQSYQSSHQQEICPSYQPLNQSNYRPNQGNQSPTAYQQQQTQYQQSQGYQSPTAYPQQQTQGYQSPTHYPQAQGYQSPTTYQQSQGHQSPNYQKSQNYQSQKQGSQSTAATYQSVLSNQQQQYQQSPSSQSQSPSRKQQKAPTAVSNAEFKIGPPPPPRASTNQQKNDNMTAIYRQQYEQHLQQQNQLQQQYYQPNSYDDQTASKQKPTAHLITENIFENNAASGTPITYKAPPAAPPKPAWPPTSPQHDGSHERDLTPSSPTYGLKNNIASVWPPRQPSVRELPRTGFNPAAVREQGTGRRCVWPPPKDDEAHNGRNTPQSPASGRKISWNPSPSPPPNRRNVFGTSHSPARRKDIAWPPPAPQTNTYREGPTHRPSPRLSRKAKFDDYIKEHAANNIPTAYRAPPGTQHVEYC